MMSCGGEVSKNEDCCPKKGISAPSPYHGVRNTSVQINDVPLSAMCNGECTSQLVPKQTIESGRQFHGNHCCKDHGNRSDEDDGRSMTASEEGLLECRQFRDVCLAFSTYEQMAMNEVERMRRNFETLNEHERAFLCQDVESRISDVVGAIELNQVFLDMVVSQSTDLVENDGIFEDSLGDTKSAETPLEPGCAIEDTEVSSMNMYKVRSTLKQFVREWSAERSEERESAFGPLLGALQTYLPLDEFKQKQGRRPWVLCPGSGLGRLPFDVVCKGYCCQGNEFSYFMLMGSNFILNHALAPESIALRPFALNSSNRRGHEDHLHTFRIPDVLAVDAVSKDVKFSMCAGDFVEVYSNQKESWDAVLTCFFIDTAKNVITYIHIIANILAPGGLWSNLGPLLYHFADSVTEVSIELSWEEIRSIITVYFDIKEERWVDCFYTTPPRSMLQVFFSTTPEIRITSGQALYHCIYFSAIRNNTPIDSLMLKNHRHNSPIRR